MNQLRADIRRVLPSLLWEFRGRGILLSFFCEVDFLGRKFIAPLPGQKMPRASVNTLLDMKVGQPAHWKSLILKWYERKMNEGRNGDYCYELARFLKHAWGKWGPIDPKEVTEDMVLIHLRSIKSERDRDNTRIALHGFLTYNGNYIMLKIPKQRSTRKKLSKVHWLSDEDFVHMITCDLNPREAMVVHMGLCLGMRRCGMVTLQMEHVGIDYVRIFEKGYYRDLPFSESKVVPRRDTIQVIKEYLPFREKLLKGKKSNSFLVGPLSPYFSDNMAKKFNGHLVRKTGIKFTYHDLRRTWGRNAWKSGIEIETISELLGHDDVIVTKRYLGINMDDMSSAMSRISDHLDSKIINFSI